MPPWGTTRLASSILTGDAGAPPAAFPLFPISPLCPISPICPICPITPLNIKGTSRRDQPPRYGWRSTRYMYSHTPYGSDGFCLRMDKYPPPKRLFARRFIPKRGSSLRTGLSLGEVHPPREFLFAFREVSFPLKRIYFVFTMQHFVQKRRKVTTFSSSPQISHNFFLIPPRHPSTSLTIFQFTMYDFTMYDLLRVNYTLLGVNYTAINGVPCAAFLMVI